MPVGYKHKTSMRRKKVPVESRFWPKVNKDAASGCWEWTASRRYGFGYGQFSIDGYPEFAHRVAWILTYGGIPDKLQVLHKCDNPLCVNPEHLFLGTQKDNSDDMVRKQRDAFIGERNRVAKLTDEKVKLARKMRAAGERFSSIAKHFGVHRWTITDAVRGITWKHIQEGVCE